MASLGYMSIICESVFRDLTCCAGLEGNFFVKNVMKNSQEKKMGMGLENLLKKKK